MIKEDLDRLVQVTQSVRAQVAQQGTFAVGEFDRYIDRMAQKIQASEEFDSEEFVKRCKGNTA